MHHLGALQASVRSVLAASALTLLALGCGTGLLEGGEGGSSSGSGASGVGGGVGGSGNSGTGASGNSGNAGTGGAGNSGNAGTGGAGNSGNAGTGGAGNAGTGGAGNAGTGGAGNSGNAGNGGAGNPTGCTAIAIQLIDEVNTYRAQNGLPAIPASTSLCFVADQHTQDLYDNAPHAPAQCNLHSWSNQGAWSPCCYTADHAEAQCMWDKPSELTVYSGNGYENAASGVSTPTGALNLWKNSSGHNAVILNQGGWANLTWNALGASIYQGYAVLWFGSQVDPAP